MVFYSFFKALVGHPVTVHLKNDLSISGELCAVDQFLNLRLDNISTSSTDNFPMLGSLNNIFIRGSVVKFINLPKEHVNIPLLEDATRRVV
ncbi:hypothetical protein P9112_002735 [Eukaryota sp. TZLM1-RC]